MKLKFCETNIKSLFIEHMPTMASEIGVKDRYQICANANKSILTNTIMNSVIPD